MMSAAVVIGILRIKLLRTLGYALFSYDVLIFLLTTIYPVTPTPWRALDQIRINGFERT